MKNSIIEKIKNNEVYPSEFVYKTNTEIQNLILLANNSLKMIQDEISESKKIVDVVSTFKITKDREKILLSGLPVYSMKNIYNDNGSLVVIPEASSSCIIEDFNISGNGSSIIESDILEFPKVYDKSGLLNGNGFVYKSPIQESFRISATVKDYYSLKRIDVLIDNSYSSSSVDISFIESSGIPVSYKKIKTNDRIIILITENLKTKNIVIGITSSSFDLKSEMFISKIKKITFSNIKNTSSSEIIFGPINANSKKILKIGASTKTIDQNISVFFSTDRTSWTQLTKYSESSYFSNINTSEENSLSIDTSVVYLKLLYNNTVENTKTKRVYFEDYAGKDFFKTGLEAGRTTVGPYFPIGITQTIYDTNTNKYILSSKKEDINYRITTPPIPVSFIDNNILEEFGGIIVNPENKFFSCSSVFNNDIAGNMKKYIYEMKSDYIAGIYEVYIGDEKKFEFDIYGDFMFSLSKFIFEVDVSESITVKIKNENKEYKESSMSSITNADKKIVSIAPIFIKDNISSPIAFLYPFYFSKENTIVDNGVNIQNGNAVISINELSYIEGKTNTLSRDEILNNFKSTIKAKELFYKRAKYIKLNNKNIVNIKITSLQPLMSQVLYIDGKTEFKKNYIKNSFEKIVNSEINTGTNIYDVDIYSSGYNVRLMRVYAKADITDQYMYYVDGEKIYFNNLLNEEYVNIILKEKNERVTEDNLFSVDFENSRVYFSTYQDNISIRYLYSDVYMEGQLYTKSQMFSNGVFEPVGIVEEEIDIENINTKTIEELEVGIVYDSGA